VDPGSLNPDPDINSDPGFFLMKKIKDKNTAENFYYDIYFKSKIAIYLSLCLYNGHPSYRRSLQPSKENIKHFKT
jgi:hypothetical protein